MCFSINFTTVLFLISFALSTNTRSIFNPERDLGLVSEEYFDDGKQRQADESVQKVDNFLRGFFDLFVALSNDSPKVFLEQNQAESDQKLSKIHSSIPTEQNEKIESTFLFHRQNSPENVSFENLKPFADVQLPTDEDLSEEIQIGDELFHFNTRTKRQVTTAGPIADLESEISTILTSLPAAIDNAVNVEQASIRFQIFKRQSQGWSIVVGSWLDMYSDILINNRTLSNLGGLTTVYRYGFIVFYGIGFGFPYLLGMPDPILGCSSKDFADVLDQYRLTNGLDDLLASDLSLTVISSLISEYDSLVRIRLDCILQYEGDIIEAEEVTFALDELRVLLDLRVAAETDLRAPAVVCDSLVPGSISSPSSGQASILSGSSVLDNTTTTSSTVTDLPTTSAEMTSTSATTINVPTTAETTTTADTTPTTVVIATAVTSPATLDSSFDDSSPKTTSTFVTSSLSNATSSSEITEKSAVFIGPASSTEASPSATSTTSKFLSGSATSPSAITENSAPFIEPASSIEATSTTSTILLGLETTSPQATTLATIEFISTSLGITDNVTPFSEVSTSTKPSLSATSLTTEVSTELTSKESAPLFEDLTPSTTPPAP